MLAISVLLLFAQFTAPPPAPYNSGKVMFRVTSSQDVQHGTVKLIPFLQPEFKVTVDNSTSGVVEKGEVITCELKDAGKTAAYWSCNEGKLKLKADTVIIFKTQ